MTIGSGRPPDGSAGPNGDRHTAPDFSVANLLLRRETDLSRVFAHLLNPGGDHAQGDAFLAALFAEVTELAKFRSLPTVGSVVTREHLTPPVEMSDGQPRSGSIDILVKLKSGQRIAIENKPWAGDQEKQVERYLRHLQELAAKSGSGDESFLLLYWSGDGDSPVWAAGANEALKRRCITMPYRKTGGHPSVEGWLGRCQTACQAPWVQWFLEDLTAYVVHWFSDVTYLLNREVEKLRRALDVDVDKRRKGWLFERCGWNGGWPGVWIWRQNQESPGLEVGASGWRDDDVRQRLLTVGKRRVGGSRLPKGTWVSHGHNSDSQKRHVSWGFDVDKVFRTDYREQGVREIVALADALLKTATTA